MTALNTATGLLDSVERQTHLSGVSRALLIARLPAPAAFDLRDAAVQLSGAAEAARDLNLPCLRLALRRAQRLLQAAAFQAERWEAAQKARMQ